MFLVTNRLEEQLLTELQSNPPPLETSMGLSLPEKQGCKEKTVINVLGEGEEGVVVLFLTKSLRWGVEEGGQG